MTTPTNPEPKRPGKLLSFVLDYMGFLCAAGFALVNQDDPTRALAGAVLFLFVDGYFKLAQIARALEAHVAHPPVQLLVMPAPLPDTTNTNNPNPTHQSEN